MPTWLTAKEAMDYLRVSKATFYRLIRAGKITVYALDGTDDKRYRQDDLDALLKPLPKGQDVDEEADD